MKNIPEQIREIGFDFIWNNRKVWELDLPVEDMEVKELEWHLDIPFWNKPDNGYYDLTPNEVLQSPDIYKDEYNRTMNADMTYPIDIMYWKKRWLMLDGLHRLVKAKLLGYDSIKARKIPREYIPKITK